MVEIEKIPKCVDIGMIDKCSPGLILVYTCIRVLRKIKERENELKDVKKFEDLAKRGESIEKHIEYIASKFLKVIEDDVELIKRHVKKELGLNNG